MPYRKADRRVERTRELLLDALVSLLKERGYEKLTIQNVLDRARVGRATFYAHFNSKEDLLSCSIARLRAGLEERWRATVTQGGKPAERLGFMLAFFEHLQSHRRIYHATIGRESEWTVELHMRRMLGDLVRADLERHRGKLTGSAALDLSVRYVVSTLWAIVVWWMESKEPLPAQEIHRIFQRLTFPGLDAATGAGW